ncbi:MAG: hypothetical protein ACFCBU_12195, partial [Cyanophyceae cyanobacterium]
MPIFHQPVNLKPGQFAYLAQQSWRLYVETIDYIAPKQSYWVRPLILTRHEPFSERPQLDPMSRDPLLPLAPHRSPTLLPAARSPLPKNQSPSQRPPNRPRAIAPSSTAPPLPPAKENSIQNHCNEKTWYQDRESPHLIWPRNSFPHAFADKNLSWRTD